MLFKKSSTEVSRRTLLKTGVWFSILNSAFVFIISLKYLTLIPDQVVSQNAFYLGVYVISHFLFISFLPYFFIYLPVTILSRNETTSKITASITATLGLILLTIDAYVFSLYRFHINSYVLEQVFGPGATQVFEFTLIQYLLVILVLLVLFFLEIGIFKLASFFGRKANMLVIYIFFSFLAATIIFSQVYHAVGVANDDRYVIAIDRYMPACISLNANELLSSCGKEISQKNVEVDFCHKSYSYPRNPLVTSSSKKNVLFITLDSWRASTMDSLSTPAIFEFTRKSSVFTNHYSGSNGTRTGVFSLFYGLPGVYWEDFCNQSIPSVWMSELQRQNYEIRLFPSASLYNPTLDKSVFLMVPEQCASAPGAKAWQRDENLVNNFLEFLDNRGSNDKPFFSFLFFDSLHSMIKPDNYKGPFQPSWPFAQYEKLGKDVDPTEFYNLYRNMAYYLDSLVALVFNKLEKNGMMENTIIVITGDHAQEFDDNHKAFWGHNGNFSSAQLHVPFIYYNADRKPATYTHWTAHYDVVPTLMHDLFDVKNCNEDYTIGKSLFDTSEREFLLVDSYIGLGIVQKNGMITNIYYDGSYNIEDSNLNEKFDAQLDTLLYQKSQNVITSFYK